MTGQPAVARRYGAWAGSPKGVPEDPARCIEEVADHSLRFTRFHQCERKRGHGPDGLYCKQHDPASVAARRAAADERYEAERRRWRVKNLRHEISEIARKIFRQEASFDDLEKAVAKLEAMLLPPNVV